MAPNQVEASETHSPQINSINRVAELPVVKSAIDIAYDRYEKLKGYNAVVGSSLSKAEQTAKYVADSAMPVVAKLEKQLSFADGLVCQGLDKLEEKVPAIKKSPDELKTVGWEKIEEIKDYGNSKVDSIKAYGYQRVNDALHSAYALAVMKSMDSAIDLTEHALDTYLPAAEGEEFSQDPSAKEDQNVIQRAQHLSNKMRNRMLKQAINQMAVLQKRSQEAVDRMKHSVDLIAYARSIEEASRQKIVSGVDTVQTSAKWLWEELKKDENEEQDANQEHKSVDQQLLSLARKATHEALNRYHQLNGVAHLLPESVQQSLAKSTDYAKDVYSQLSTASNLRDVSDIALSQMSAAVKNMQQVMSHTLTPALRSLDNQEADQENSQ